MHQQVRDFVREVTAEIGSRHPCIVEIGSYDLNGTIRDQFEAERYIGADVYPGPGVDLVASGVELAADMPGIADVVVCTGMLEHDPEWRATVAALVDLARVGGWVIITCASDEFPPHSGRVNGRPEPDEHYQNVALDDLRAVLATLSVVVSKIELRERRDLVVLARRCASKDDGTRPVVDVA